MHERRAVMRKRQYHTIDKAKFQQFLLKHGITRRDFCEKMGFSESTLSKKLNGITKWSLDELLKVKTELNLSKTEFYDIFFA